VRKLWKLAVGAAALTLTIAAPVKAQTAGATVLQGTTTITDGSWTITLTGCTKTPAGGSAAACSGTDEVTPSITGSTISLVFSSFSGSSSAPLETAGAGQFSDLTFVTIKATYTGQSINASSVNVSGSESAGNSAFATSITVNEGTIASTGGPGATTSLGNSPTLQSVAFAPVSSETVLSTDIKTSGARMPSGSLTMSTATISFTTVPEPISASLLVVGVAGLGFVRRKTRQLN
jgi:hypothetical protein